MLFALIGATWASPPPPPPIVNGETTDDYPQVVLIRFTTPSESVAFVCTGTLVAPDVVLTAAHCLTDPDGYGLTDVRVFMGTVWTPAAPERLASEWIIHPEYSVDPDGTNVHADLGLVWLPEPYDLDGEVLNAQPITEADLGRDLRYVGWGASDDGATDAGYFKRVADIPITGLEGEFLLAGGEDPDGGATCGGDSGGPAFELAGGAPVALAAVHSFARDDDGTVCDGSVSGDTRVDLYLDWIASHVDVTTDAPGGDSGDDTGTGDTSGDNGDDNGGASEDEDRGGCSTAPASPGGLLGSLLLLRARRRR